MKTLFMAKIGAKPKGRLIEQHDIFFGVANNISELIPAIDKHWSEVAGEWHLDAYRPVTIVDNHHIRWQENASGHIDHQTNHDTNDTDKLKLYFINLGGYLPNHFEEYHHKLLIVAPNQSEAIKKAKSCEFYQTYHFDDPLSSFDAASHIDDKMQVDVDDIYEVNQLITQGNLIITPIKSGESISPDKQEIGYISLKKLQKQT